MKSIFWIILLLPVGYTNAQQLHQHNLTTGSPCTAGLNDQEPTDFHISPNPFEEKLLINCPQEGCIYVLLNAQGQVLVSGQSDQQEMMLNTGVLPEGIYLLRLTSATHSRTLKLLHL